VLDEREDFDSSRQCCALLALTRLYGLFPEKHFPGKTFPGKTFPGQSLSRKDVSRKNFVSEF